MTPATVTVLCSHVACQEPRVAVCENCDASFCSDHDSIGGDRQVQDIGAVAVPSSCWACGGFDADADPFEEVLPDPEYGGQL